MKAKERRVCQQNDSAEASKELLGSGLASAFEINGQKLREHFGGVVRDTVEQTLNAFLEAEAARLCGAGRYERSPDRKDTRAGHCRRRLDTVAGRVELRVPKLRRLPFETQIIDRYQRRQASVEEALVEMYLAGVSVRRWKTSPRHSGARGSAPPRSAI